MRKTCWKLARQDGAACHGVGALAISTPMPVPKIVRMTRCGRRRFLLRKLRFSSRLASCLMMIVRTTETRMPIRKPAAACPRTVNRSRATSVAVSSAGSMQTTVAADACEVAVSLVSVCWPTRPAGQRSGGTALGSGRRWRNSRAARIAPPRPGRHRRGRVPPSRWSGARGIRG